MANAGSWSRNVATEFSYSWMRGTKIVHKAVKLVKGRAVIVVKRQPKGAQAFTVHFKGNKKLSQTDKTFTVRVRK